MKPFAGPVRKGMMERQGRRILCCTLEESVRRARDLTPR